MLCRFVDQSFSTFQALKTCETFTEEHISTVWTLWVSPTLIFWEQCSHRFQPETELSRWDQRINIEGQSVRFGPIQFLPISSPLPFTWLKSAQSLCYWLTGNARACHILRPMFALEWQHIQGFTCNTFCNSILLWSCFASCKDLVPDISVSRQSILSRNVKLAS